MYYDYEAPPPQYEKPKLPLFTEESLVYVLAAVRHDKTLNTTGLFHYHVKIEARRLEATGLSEDESEKIAKQNVTKAWATSGYPQFSDLDQFTPGIIKVVKALVGKPVATIWSRDNDSFESWLLSRPWVQFKIAYWITTHHDKTEEWPEIYRRKAPQYMLRIEWLGVQDQEDHCGGWLWKGEDAEQVKKGLQQPYPRRSQRLVKRQLMEEREASLLAQRKERLAMMRAQEPAEEKEKQVQAKVLPKTKQDVKTKKPSPTTATKKATKPKGAKQEPTKRGKTTKEVAPKKRKTTTKEPVSKKRKTAEPAKAKKTKADDQAATKRRKVTKP